MANDKFTVVGTNIAEKATMIWNVADMLRGPFKPHEYGLAILKLSLTRGTLYHDKLIADKKLESSARTSDTRIFVESVFPAAFGTAAMESFMESQESYSALFEDQTKYNAVMTALAGIIYREMRQSVGT